MSAFYIYESGIRPFGIRESQRIDRLLDELGVTPEDKVDVLVGHREMERIPGDSRGDYKLGDFRGEQKWRRDYRVKKIENGRVFFTGDKIAEGFCADIIFCQDIVDIKKA